MITFTVIPFMVTFETELTELDWRYKNHDGPHEGFEEILKDLDWATTPFEEKLAMLDYKDAET